MTKDMKTHAEQLAAIVSGHERVSISGLNDVYVRELESDALLEVIGHPDFSKKKLNQKQLILAASLCDAEMKPLGPIGELYAIIKKFPARFLEASDRATAVNHMTSDEDKARKND